MSLKEMNLKRAIIIVGKTDTEKKEKLLQFVSEGYIFKYANEYDIEDNYSIPIDTGIVIDDCHYKANVDLIRKTILEYRGQVVLMADNQKDVSKTIFNLCKLKRATKKDTSIQEIAPRARPPHNFDVDTFSLVREYLTSTNREDIRTTLNISKPPDVQLLSWLAPNLHPNKLSFVDFHVGRKWSTKYFYDLLAYAHDGRMNRKMQMPKRRAYSQIPKICRKLKLKPSEVHLLKDLLKDEAFKEYAKSKLDNGECRILKLGEKKRRKKTDVIIAQSSLEQW